MKILILSITAGQGHLQTGKAIVDYFEKNSHTAFQLDCYEYLSPIIKETVSNGYLVSTKYSPKLYGKAYEFLEKYDEYDPPIGLVKGTNHIFYKKLMKYIDEDKPDAIVCTHVFAAILMTYIKRKKETVPTIGIITDFRLHPYWECTNMDYYVVANEFLQYSMLQKNLPKEKLLPFGIPINEKFSSKMTSMDSKQQIGLNDEKLILVMGGSMGFGNMIKTIGKIDELELEFGIILVCGNNKKLYNSVRKKQFKHNFYSYGYVNNVDTLMDACDCIVTKPGGLTTSEALAKQIPMVLTKPIPGQEERNIDFLLNFGVAMKSSKNLSVEEAVYQLISSDEKSKLMKTNMELIRKPNAVKDLYDFILKISN